MGVEKSSITQSEINPKTLVANVENLGFASYDKTLFEGLSLNIKSREVTAITGKSGSGKTVLLKILAGEEKQQEGRVFVNAKAKVIFVPQELEDMNIDSDLTIRQLLKGSRGLIDIEAEMSKYEDLLTEQQHNDKDIEKYGEAMELYQKLGGYSSNSDIERVLSGLGLDQKTTSNISLDTKLGEVSSGQLRKIMIAMALYSRASLILLDEPSSHLDVKSVEWMTDYLKHSESAVVITSNNSEFVDSCATQTVGLTDIGRVFVFEGGYTEFVRKRNTILEAEKIEAEQVANKLDQLKKTDAMFRSKQAYKRSPDMAQVGRALESRMNRLKDEYNSMPGSKQTYKEEKVRDLSFTQERRSGTDVISINGVIKRYGEYSAVDLSRAGPISIRQGEKWLFWGPNGSGKSTLVRMIAESIQGGTFLPDEGVIRIGAGIELGYYMPEVPIDIKHGLLIDELTRNTSRHDQGKASSILRFFGFSSTSIHRQDVRTLSSGEKKRFALARIMIKQSNFIILDEPTGDYMPEEIKERLASALDKFNGTLILVSHDRDFIKRLKIDKELDMPKGKVIIKK